LPPKERNLSVSTPSKRSASSKGRLAMASTSPTATSPRKPPRLRALNFTKGCYLGQEIVERIRSRATVHRSLRQFELDGALPSAPADLRAAGAAASIGQLTSIAEIRLSEIRPILALGFIRNEALERKSRIEYDGGEATVREHPPVL
jgi:hypothetical protein